MKISDKGLKLIKEFEGLSLTPYLCSAKIPTIGYGNTFYKDGSRVTLKDNPITENEAEDLLRWIVDNSFCKPVFNNVKVPLNQNEFDALVSFAYNVGTGAFRESTLLRKLNQGDYQGASLEFSKWTRAGGKVLPGLVKRREKEKQLFLSK